MSCMYVLSGVRQLPTDPDSCVDKVGRSPGHSQSCLLGRGGQGDYWRCGGLGDARRAAEKRAGEIEAQGDPGAEEDKKIYWMTPLSEQKGLDLIPTLSSKEGLMTFAKKLISFCQDEACCAKQTWPRGALSTRPTGMRLRHGAFSIQSWRQAQPREKEN